MMLPDTFAHQLGRSFRRFRGRIHLFDVHWQAHLVIEHSLANSIAQHCRSSAVPGAPLTPVTHRECAPHPVPRAELGPFDRMAFAKDACRWCVSRLAEGYVIQTSEPETVCH